MNEIKAHQPTRSSHDDFDRKLLGLILEQMQSGVLVARAPDGEVVLANPQMRQMWRTADAVDPATWVGAHPDGTPYEPDEWPLARALRDGEHVEDEEIEITRGDGTRGVVRFTAVPVHDANGEVQAALLTGIDVTEQRRQSMSQRFLADAGTLLASSLDYISTLRNLARLAVPLLADWCTVDLLDNSGEIERVALEHTDPKRSAAAMQIARRHPPTLESEVGVERVIRTGISELITEVTPDVVSRFTRNEKQRKFLSELKIKSVMIVPMVARGSPIGAITFVSAESGRRYTADDLEVAEELTTRAALGVENSRLFDQSRAADEAKSDFLAVMSHELRTPLTAIIGYAELLQLGVPDPVTTRQHEQAERIEVSARHLLQLIEEILTLVTLESGVRRVQREEVDVNKLLRRAVSIIEPMARAKNLPIHVELAKGEPVLRSDADKLLQILLNLLSNSVKFTEAGEIWLKGRTEEQLLLLEVTDTGIGMGPEHLQRIFEPFWQVERPITRRAGGTGLGLTISRRLADLLGAEIEVSSEPGQGSTFIVRVPL